MIGPSPAGVAAARKSIKIIVDICLFAAWAAWDQIVFLVRASFLVGQRDGMGSATPALVDKLECPSTRGPRGLLTIADDESPTAGTGTGRRVSHGLAQHHIKR